MIQTVLLTLVFLFLPNYSQLPQRRCVVPAKSEDPTVAPHIPHLPRMSTMASPERGIANLPVPCFLHGLKPVDSK
jgi:hypothetical protein